MIIIRIAYHGITLPSNACQAPRSSAGVLLSRTPIMPETDCVVVISPLMSTISVMTQPGCNSVLLMLSPSRSTLSDLLMMLSALLDARYAYEPPEPLSSTDPHLRRDMRQRGFRLAAEQVLRVQCLCKHQRTDGVCVEHFQHGSCGHLAKSDPIAVDTGVVDDEVEVLVLGGDLGGELCDRGLVAHVELEHVVCHAVLQVAGVPATSDDNVVFGLELSTELLPNAPGRPSDERDLVRDGDHTMVV